MYIDNCKYPLKEKDVKIIEDTSSKKIKSFVMIQSKCDRTDNDFPYELIKYGNENSFKKGEKWCGTDKNGCNMQFFRCCENPPPRNNIWKWNPNPNQNCILELYR